MSTFTVVGVAVVLLRVAAPNSLINVSSSKLAIRRLGKNPLKMTAFLHFLPHIFLAKLIVFLAGGGRSVFPSDDASIQKMLIRTESLLTFGPVQDRPVSTLKNQPLEKGPFNFRPWTQTNKSIGSNRYKGHGWFYWPRRLFIQGFFFFLEMQSILSSTN